jgi:hypothetical protein
MGGYMIKMLTACTEEIDEITDAAAEILEQLDLDSNLAANSIGIISCDPEFVHSGVVGALAKKLPFDTIGVTTRGGAVTGAFSSMQLNISVLTADDVQFSIERSGAISSENVDEVIAGAYQKALGKLPGKPSLVLAYPPMIASIGAYPIVDAIFKAVENIPVFGTLPCSPFVDNRDSFTIMNGAAESASAAFVLLSGNVNPDFFMISIPEENYLSKENYQKQRGIITKSEGCRVYTINDMSFAAYLEKLGFPASYIAVDALYLIPFMLNFDDGNPPIARALYNINDEGAAIFGGSMPAGKTISPGSLNYDGILETTEELLQQISLKKNINYILMYSCVVRHVLLGAKTDDELKKIVENIGDLTPYQVCYSNGEICPVKNSKGEFVNRLHNYTFVACVL